MQVVADYPKNEVSPGEDTADPATGDGELRADLDQRLVAQLAPSLLDASFYRRLRVLLRTAPFHRLRELRTRQSWPAERIYDPMEMAAAAVDQVVARSCRVNEYDFDTLVGDLASLAGLAEPDAAPSEWRCVAEWVVRSMLGEDESTTEYSVEHGDYRGGYRLTPLRWHLLREVQRADGRIVLTASVEVINAMRTGLDLDVEDAQLAQETVLRAQLERGDLGAAEDSADEGMRLSLELAAKMRDLLDLTRLNLDAVDWESQFQSRVDRALAHIEARINAEHDMIEHLSTSADFDDDDVRRRALEIREKIRRCLTQHRILHGLLITAPKVFLDEQLRQSLGGRTRSRLRIVVTEDLLLPTLALDLEPATDVVSVLQVALAGPNPRRLLHLGAIITSLLHTTSDDEAAVVPEEIVTLVERPSDELDPDLLVTAYDLLRSCRQGPRLLSDLLAETDDPAVAELVRLLAQLLFDPEDTEAHSFGFAGDATLPLEELGSALAGRTFHAAGYYGDDLLVGAADLVAHSVQSAAHVVSLSIGVNP